MKVTKLIKDYVTEQVTIAYENRTEDAIKEYQQNYCFPVQEIIDRCIASFNEQIKEELSNKGFVLTNYFTDMPLKELVKVTCNNYKINGTSVNEVIAKLSTERDNKVKEILVTLELGGTKEQLDEMLKNL